MTETFEQFEYEFKLDRKWRHREITAHVANNSAETYSIQFDVRICKANGVIQRKYTISLDNVAPGEKMERFSWIYPQRGAKYCEICLVRLTKGRASLRPVEISQIGEIAQEKVISIRLTL